MGLAVANGVPGSSRLFQEEKQMKDIRMMVQAACMLVAAALVGSEAAGEVALVVGRSDFALVRDEVELDLQKGPNKIQIKDLPDFLRPETVMLRDPAGKSVLRIREQEFQSYTDEALASACEGMEVDLMRRNEIGPSEALRGKLIRAGYRQVFTDRYGGGYSSNQIPPVFEVNGKLLFNPSGGGYAMLLPMDIIQPRTLSLTVESDAAAKVKAELIYETGGLGWTAFYNVAASAKGDVLEIAGVASIENTSGKTFDRARVKLMSGEIVRQKKVDPYRGSSRLPPPEWAKGIPSIDRDTGARQSFTLPGPVTLRNVQPRQFEFLHAAGVKAVPICVYDGLKINWDRYSGYGSWDEAFRNSDFGTQCSTQVWSMLEVANTAANNLGMHLPEGTIRLYQRGDDGYTEYVGENPSAGVAAEGMLRVFAGVAPRLTAERTRVSRNDDRNAGRQDEVFRIVVYNSGPNDSDVLVVEHLYRSAAYTITTTTHKYREAGKQTIEFPVKVPAGTEVAVEYTVSYTR